jgi:sarcosine oxidase subunit gamma
VTAEARLSIGAPTYPAQVDLRVDPSDAAHLAFECPLQPNTWTPAGQGWEALWLAPDGWLVVAEHAAAAAIVLELDAALDGLHRSVLDVSSDRTAIELDGPGRFDLLSRGCGLDLHPRSWLEGMCAQTLFARVPVILQERGPRTTIFVRPSYLGYLTAWLADAVR